VSAAPAPPLAGWRRWLQLSLSRQLLMPIAALWVVSFFIATGAAYWLAGRSTSDSFDRLLADDARALAAQLRWNQGQAHFDASREMADALVFDSLSLNHYGVVTAAGRPLVGSLPLPESLQQATPADDNPHFFSYRTPSGTDLRAVALLVRPSGGGEAVWVVVAESKTKRRQVKDQIAMAIFVPAGLAGFIILPLVYHGIRRGLAPTRRVSALVVQQGENDLSPLAVDEVPEELRDLVAHTNALLARLKASVDEQRRFVADAAHQLQTPMAGIRLLVGDMRRTQQADPRQPMDGEVLAHLDEVAARGARMVRQLLAYARAEEESVVEDLVFDAAGTARQAAGRWNDAARAAGKALTIRIPDQAHAVRGSPTLLGEVVSNLIDNALRYGGPHVAVEVLSLEGGVRIQVCDDGPALDAATRERMLLPFWRGDHGQPEGSGLGLSIAQRVVQRMGGHLGVQAGPGGQGTCVAVELPHAEPPDLSA
jgi:two-component system sensor histidine kinase TctE